MVPKQSRLLILNTIRGALFNVPTLRLAKNNAGPADADIVLADFVECDFDGYASQNPAWGAPTLDGAFIGVMQTGTLQWTAGAGLAAPQTIHALYVTIADPTAGGAETLLFFERIAPTVTLALPGEQFQRIVKLRDTNF